MGARAEGHQDARTTAEAYVVRSVNSKRCGGRRREKAYQRQRGCHSGYSAEETWSTWMRSTVVAVEKQLKETTRFVFFVESAATFDNATGLWLLGLLIGARLSLRTMAKPRVSDFKAREHLCKRHVHSFMSDAHSYPGNFYCFDHSDSKQPSPPNLLHLNAAGWIQAVQRPSGD